MNDKIPVHLICGFLGSGKTTLVRRILAEQPPGEKLAVLVNEFGELGIDGRLLQGFESQVMELASGCICCTLKADFITSLNRLIRDFSPQRVVVEATGLAEAGDLSRAVEAVAAHGRVFLASVATVVDADFFTYREMLGPLYFNQIRQADLVLLNKTDLIEDTAVEPLVEALSAINPRARIMPVVHCAVERQIILEPLAPPPPFPSSTARSAFWPDLTKVPGDAENHSHHHDSTAGFTSFFHRGSGVFDPECLDAFLENLPWGIFRVKGFARLPEKSVIINYTYRRPEISPTTPVSLTELNFIGFGIDPEKIITALEGCLSVREEEP